MELPSPTFTVDAELMIQNILRGLEEPAAVAADAVSILGDMLLEERDGGEARLAEARSVVHDSPSGDVDEIWVQLYFLDEVWKSMNSVRLAKTLVHALSKRITCKHPYAGALDHDQAEMPPFQ